MQSMCRNSIAKLYKTLITLNSRRQPFQLYCTAASSPINVDIDSDVTTHHVDDNGGSSSSSDKPKRKKRGKQKDKLYMEISPLRYTNCNVAPLIDEWVKNGNKVRFAELQRITRDLRKRMRFSQALQVSEWMKDNEAFTFKQVQHAVHIDLLGKVHGCLSAENYFNNLSEENKTEKTYGALLHCYANQGQTAKALSHVQTMKEKGLEPSSVVYNCLMNLYTKTGKYEMVLDLLSKMKENGISPDSMTYKICLNAYGQLSDTKGMESLLLEMERQPDFSVDWNAFTLAVNYFSKKGLTEKANDFLKTAEARLSVGDAEGYNHLISLNATLGNKSDVFRLWILQKNTCKRLVNEDYITILNSLVKLNELQEAEKLLEEWGSSENKYDLRILYIFIDKYIDMGQYSKAEGMLKDMIEKGKSPYAHRWGKVVAGHLDLGNTTSAVECMKIALSSRKEKKWTPDHSLMTRLLDVLGVEESSSDIDTLVDAFLTHTSEEKTNLSKPDLKTV